MSKLKFTLLVTIVALVVCSAVDIELAEEGPCLDPPPQVVSFDKATFSNTSLVWHHHLWSKYYAYRVASDVTRKEYEDITDRDIQNSCLRFSPTGQGGVTEKGFFGLQRIYELGAGKREGTFQWKASGNSDWDGETWVTKADSDYFVAVTCFATNQRAVTVASLQTKLSVKRRLEIIDHIRSLGFDSKYFFEPNIENCVAAQSPTNGNGNTGYYYRVPSRRLYYPAGFNSK